MKRSFSALVITALVATICATLARAQTAETTDGVLGMAPASFAARAVASPKSRFGVSVGVRESYATTPTSALSGSSSDLFTSVTPRIFGSVRKRYSELSFSYALGYNRYDRRQGDTITTSHALDATLRRTLSRKVSVYISDAFSSSLNDYGTTVGGEQMIQGGAFTPVFDVPRQRVTQNALSAGIDFQLGRKGSITVSGTHNYRLYETALGDNQDAQATIHSQYKVNKWLSFNNGYTNQFNAADEQSSSSTIQRVQLGGLDFKSRRGFGFSVGGGIEGAQQNGIRQVRESAEVGFSKTSKSTVVSLNYHHGLSRPVHSQSVLLSNDVAASLNRWLSKRVNFRVNAGYMYGSSQQGAASKSISAGATLGIQLQKHLLLSTDYSYISQDVSNATLLLPGKNNRYTLGLGLEYFLPSLSGR